MNTQGRVISQNKSHQQNQLNNGSKSDLIVRHIIRKISIIGTTLCWSERCLLIPDDAKFNGRETPRETKVEGAVLGVIRTLTQTNLLFRGTPTRTRFSRFPSLRGWSLTSGAYNELRPY